MSDTDYVSSQDAADRLGYTRQHVRRLIRQKRLDGRKVGRDWIVLASSVERYLAERENFDLPLRT
jgi:excisionase family DNA binding protein